MKKVLEACHSLLFGSTALTDIVGTKIYEAFGPPNASWPLVHYFNVASGTGYNVDYNDIIIQFSCYSTDIVEARNIQEIIYRLFNRYSGIITTYYGDADINYTEHLDGGYVESADPDLYGYYTRFLFRYRGENIGG